MRKYCPNYLPPPFPQFGQFFSGVEIQDLKVSLGLKILYIHYNIQPQLFLRKPSLISMKIVTMIVMMPTMKEMPDLLRALGRNSTIHTHHPFSHLFSFIFFLQKSDKGQILYWSSQTCTRVRRLFGCLVVTMLKNLKTALFQTYSTWHPNTFCPYCLILT